MHLPSCHFFRGKKTCLFFCCCGCLAPASTKEIASCRTVDEVEAAAASMWPWHRDPCHGCGHPGDARGDRRFGGANRLEVGPEIGTSFSLGTCEELGTSG